MPEPEPTPDDPITFRNAYGRGAAAKLRRWAHEALLRHQAEDTLPTSVRHLFYEAVMAVPPVIDKGAVARATGRGRRPDQNLGEAVTWLREEGLVGWGAIEDRTRHIEDRRGNGPTIAEGVEGLLDRIRLDPWGDTLPVIVAESESIAGVLVRLADQYRVPIVPTKGQAHGWLRTTVADRIGDRAVAVGYLGDADKAGADIEWHTQRVLHDVLAVEHWQRVALTWEQVEGPPRLPTVLRTDGRDKRTREVCEVEALPQVILQAEVERFLADWLPEGVDLDDVQERERAEREELRRLLAPAEGEP